MSKRSDFSPIMVVSHFSIGNVLKEHLGIFVVGFLVTVTFGVLSLFPGGYGERSLHGFNEFIKHAMAIDSKIFAFAGLFSAPAIAFRGHELANFIRDYVSKPFIGFLAHTAALGCGALIGIAMLHGFNNLAVATLTWGQIGIATFVFSILFFETFFAYLCAHESVTKKYVPQMPFWMFAVIGGIVFVCSILDLCR